MIIPDIPDKKYFTIGQVSRLLGIKPHILRYWEQEFPVLKPRKTSKGRRVFVRKDIILIARIHDLLQVQRFTLEGARRRLNEETVAGPVPLYEGRRFALKKIQKVKQDLRDLLKDIEEGLL
jgi:DNA-binding transcriptional MerR regulator